MLDLPVLTARHFFVAKLSSITTSHLSCIHSLSVHTHIHMCVWLGDRAGASPSPLPPHVRPCMFTMSDLQNVLQREPRNRNNKYIRRIHILFRYGKIILKMSSELNTSVRLSVPFIVALLIDDGTAWKEKKTRTYINWFCSINRNVGRTKNVIFINRTEKVTVNINKII